MLIDGTPVNCCQFRALRMRRAEEMLRLQALKLWFCQTPNPSRTPVFYTFTKIHNSGWKTHNIWM